MIISLFLERFVAWLDLITASKFFRIVLEDQAKRERWLNIASLHRKRQDRWCSPFIFWQLLFTRKIFLMCVTSAHHCNCKYSLHNYLQFLLKARSDSSSSGASLEIVQKTSNDLTHRIRDFFSLNTSAESESELHHLSNGNKCRSTWNELNESFERVNLHSAIDIINQIFANKALELECVKKFAFNWFCLMTAGKQIAMMHQRDMRTIHCDLSTVHDGSCCQDCLRGFLSAEIIGQVRSDHADDYRRDLCDLHIHNVSPKSIIEDSLICIQKQFKKKMFAAQAVKDHKPLTKDEQFVFIK